MDLNSFLRSSGKHPPPYERFSTESPVLQSISPSRYLSYQKLYKTQENNYTSSKTEFEDDYNEKIATMRHFYQMRLMGFEDSLNKLYQRLFDDELMKKKQKQWQSKHTKQYFSNLIGKEQKKLNFSDVVNLIIHDPFLKKQIKKKGKR